MYGSGQPYPCCMVRGAHLASCSDEHGSIALADQLGDDVGHNIGPARVCVCVFVCVCVCVCACVRVCVCVCLLC